MPLSGVLAIIEGLMRNLILLFLSGLAFTYSLEANSYCETLMEQKLKSDLSLSYKKFDQTMNSGWRTIAEQNCYKEAAQLITKYIEKHDSTENSLKWHLFQMEAYSGNYDRALKLENAILINAEQASANKLLWNEYVIANIAFLENDLEKLKQQRSLIAAKKEEHFGNGLNLKIVDNLINGFGKPYRVAYEGK